MAQLKPFDSRQRMLAGNFTMVVKIMMIDIAAGGLDNDPKAMSEVNAVLAFWTGPITCSNLVL